MTLVAIDRVAAIQWEEVVVNIGTGPIKCIHIVAFRTIGGIVVCHVIGAGGGFIVSLVAIIAFHAKRCKAQV